MKLFCVIFLLIINSCYSTQTQSEIENPVVDQVINDLYKQFTLTANEVLKLESEDKQNPEYSEKINNLYRKVDNMKANAYNELNELLVKTFSHLLTGRESKNSNDFEPVYKLVQQFLTSSKSNSEGLADMIDMFQELLKGSALKDSGLEKFLGLSF
jgi:Zn-dependent M32 family carboxypeptidase